MFVHKLLVVCLLFLTALFASLAIAEEQPASSSDPSVPFADIPLYGKSPAEAENGSRQEISEPIQPQQEWSPEATNAFSDILYVQSLGDPERIVFEGVTLFPKEQLRRALALDLKYQAAARPSNQTADFLDTLEEQLREGYLHSGCRDAKVRARRDGARREIIVHVDEGQQYRNGSIYVTGMSDQDERKIVDLLTTPQNARPYTYLYGDKPLGCQECGDDTNPTTVWKPGDATDGRDAAKTELEKGIRLALLDAGFAGSFLAKQEINAETGFVDLHIHLQDDISRVEIEEIEVTGLKRDSEQALLNYLHIARGDQIDREYLQRIGDRLSDSCRYWQHELAVALSPVSYRTDELPENKAKLRLTLEEYKPVPPLSKPLVPADETLRRCAAWIRTLRANVEGKDFVCTAASADLRGTFHNARIALAANGTIAIEARVDSLRGWRADHTLIFGSHGGEIYD